MPASVISGDQDADRGLAVGVREHGADATGGRAACRRPRRRFAIRRAGDGAIRRAVDEGRAIRRYRGRTVSRSQKIDAGMAAALLVLGVAEAIIRDDTIGWLVSAVVNASAVCFRRRQPVLALIAVIVVQAAVHDATYDTDPLSPFLAELILLFTVGYELHARQALLGLLAAIVYVSIDFMPTMPPIPKATTTKASQPNVAVFQWVALQRPMRDAMLRLVWVVRDMTSSFGCRGLGVVEVVEAMPRR
jgi:hypothetical protein